MINLYNFQNSIYNFLNFIFQYFQQIKIRTFKLLKLLTFPAYRFPPPIPPPKPHTYLNYVIK